MLPSSYFDPGTTQVKIVGGSAAIPNSYPYHVILQKETGEILCSGAIINALFVLTAAHCLADTSLKSIKVIAGGHDRTISEQNQQIGSIQWTVSHAEFNRTLKRHDIALIRLNASLDFNKYVNSIKIPKAGTQFVGQVATATGWGSLGEDQYPKVLQHSLLPIISRTKCSLLYGKGTITTEMMCAGMPYRDTCQGDSGGPLACRNSSTGEPILCGIVTHGSGCGYSGAPGINIDVARYSTWIEDVLSSRIKPTKYADTDSLDYISVVFPLFTCKNNRTIQGRWKCDGDNDCSDWSDEIDCMYFGSPAVLFKCNNGTYIRDFRHCDGVNDCGDWADEKNCLPPKVFQCQDGKLTNFRNQCNGYRDCLDASDELNCIKQTYTNFTCDNGLSVGNDLKCNDIDNCNDFSDELFCPNSTTFSCSSSLITIPSIAQCDNVNHCGDWEDEIGCKDSDGNPHTFQCPSGNYTSTSSRCNFQNDCGDWSDEFNCTGAGEIGSRNSTIFFCENGGIVSNLSRCNSGINDCGDWSDEAGCIRPDGNFSTFFCDNGRIVTYDYRCDGGNDCGDASDEIQCTNSYGTSNAFQCKSRRWLTGRTGPSICDSYNNCGDWSDEIGCRVVGKPSIFFCGNGKIIKYNFKCDGVNDCGDWPSSDEKNCPTRPTSTTASPPTIRPPHWGPCGAGRVRCIMHLPYIGQCPPPSFICDGEEQCINGEDEACRGIYINTTSPTITTTVRTTTTANVYTPSTDCPPSVAYICGGTYLSGERCIPLSWKCDGTIDCPLLGDDEEGCPPEPTEPTSFKRGASHCSDIGQFKCPSWDNCIPFEWLCDGIQDCLNNEDEHNANCTKLDTSPLPVGFYHVFGIGRQFALLKPPCENRNKVRCPLGHCIFKQFLCDGEDDCFDGGWDEVNCTTSNVNNATQRTTTTDLRLTLTVGTVETTSLNIDYSESTTEINGISSVEQIKNMIFGLSNNTVTTPNDNPIEEGNNVNGTEYKCPADSFYCYGSMCIPNAKVCDGVLDCPLGEDEANCIADSDNGVNYINVTADDNFVPLVQT